jgi:hypothetical protein
MKTDSIAMHYTWQGCSESDAIRIVAVADGVVVGTWKT